MNRKKTIAGIAFFIFIFALFSSLVFFSTPRQTLAYAGVVDIVFDPANFGINSVGAGSQVLATTKDTVLDTIAWTIAKIVVQKITAQTVNWVNSGFKGNPAYVTDPGQFFLNIGDNVASNFLSNSPGLNNLCSPFKAQVRLALVKSYLSDTDSSGNNFSCTISKVIANYDDFISDFSKGGWDGWFAVTQNSVNNPYGAYFAAKENLNIQIGTQNNKYQKQLDYGNGFFSLEKCLGTEVTDVATGQKKCEGRTETVTPGTVIEKQLNQLLPSGAQGLIQADEISEVIASLMTQLIGKVTGGGGSLRGTSQADPMDSGRVFLEKFAQGTPESIASNEATKENLINSTAAGLKSPLPTAPDQPFIYLKGLNPMDVLVGTPFFDSGAGAFDAKDSDISGNIAAVGFVNTNIPGNYTITYDVTNSLGVPANTVTRTVQVVTDPTAPVITGVCGNADRSYDSAFQTDFGLGDTFCDAGSPDITPAFPTKGNSVQWTCMGQNGGGASPMCTANVL